MSVTRTLRCCSIGLARGLLVGQRIDSQLQRAVARVERFKLALPQSCGITNRLIELILQALAFVANEYGRPELSPGREGLRFNLSHADGLAALAIAREAELGVDVEDTARRSRPEDIAEHFFAAAEVAALMRLPAEQRPRRFFDLWTLKEAYIKARGKGLSIPLGSFAYDLSRGPGAIELAIDPSLGDVRAGWHLTLADPTPRHRFALAVRFPGGRAPVLRTRWIWPEGPGLLG